MKWSNVTLAQFQQTDDINRKNLSDIDKVLYSICVLFDMTEYELNNHDPEKVVKMMAEVKKLYESPMKEMPYRQIGKYVIIYDVSVITLGQYAELVYFFSNPIKNAHYILASMSKIWKRKYVTINHRRRAEYFLKQPVEKVIGSLKAIRESFEAFNLEYQRLFGVDTEVSGNVQDDEFNKRYGWIYSATQVAEHERITLDAAFGLPVRQAFNVLAYIKAKSKYEAQQLKKIKPVT